MSNSDKAAKQSADVFALKVALNAEPQLIVDHYVRLPRRFGSDQA